MTSCHSGCADVAHFITTKLDDLLVKSLVRLQLCFKREWSVLARCCSTGPRAVLQHLSGRSADQGRQIFQLRYGGNAFGGEHAAAFQLPVLVLLHQHRPNQAGDRGIVREDADDAGAALNEPICLAHLSERHSPAPTGWSSRPFPSTAAESDGDVAPKN